MTSPEHEHNWIELTHMESPEREFLCANVYSRTDHTLLLLRGCGERKAEPYEPFDVSDTGRFL